MKSREIFKNISPLDHRYSIAEQDVFDALVPWLSEEASVAACARAEAALAAAHLAERGKLSAELKEELFKTAAAIRPEDVYAEEELTKHNMRALVNVFKRAAPAGTAHLIHLGATSADILDSAFSFRIKHAAQEIVLPLLRNLVVKLCDIAEREAETPQIGRTHGQRAVPVTAGFAFAEYVSRLGKSVVEMTRRASELKGKLSGAVGAYNALGMITDNPERLERVYLDMLGLEPSEHSTQLVEPEYLLRLLLEMNTAFGIIANLADDLRNLQRSEIGEVREGFAGTQVGSSTMPQKRNPWNSEHVKSLWKAFMPRVMTFFMDQISEHQRDLTNSASQRFVAEYITGFALSVRRMLGVIEGLEFDRARLNANLNFAGTGILAEPAYILLAESGISDAHEVIRRITLAAEQEGIDFSQALIRDKSLLSVIEQKMRELHLIHEGEDAFNFFHDPCRYRGLAAEKARALAKKYRKLMEGCNT